MKGWVYVISNRAMPGLVKVGYSAKNPDLRAKGFNLTNSPHPFVVEYDMLIEEPYQIEQRAHKYLSSVREKKEWFRCNAEEAIAAIQRAANGTALVENFKRAHREKAEGIRKQREAKEQRQRTLTERLRAIEAKSQEQETAIYEKYEHYLMGKYPKDPFWQYWLGCTFAVSILIIMLVSEKSDNWIFLMSIFGGAIAAVFVKGHVEAKERKSPEYRSILEKRDAKIEAVRQQQSKLNELANAQNTEWVTLNDKAISVYQRASSGDARDQFTLGHMFYKGNGVEKDAAKALEWFEKAAVQGNPRAHFYLGLMYLSGFGVSKDLVKAMECYTKSVDQGSAAEQNWLAHASEQNWLTQSINDENALTKLAKKAAGGDSEAQLKLGDTYSNDYDFDEAIEWYTKAADQGHAEARARLKNMCRIREGVPPEEASSPPELYEEVTLIPPAEILTPSSISNQQLATVSWAIGQNVLHPKFGQGVILSYQENQGYQASSAPTIKINFAAAGEKLLSLAHTRLTVLGNNEDPTNEPGHSPQLYPDS